MSGPFKPTSLWKSVQNKEIEAFEQGVVYGAQHWKANHDRIVKRLRNTPQDLLDAEKEIAKLRRQVAHYAESNRILEEALERTKERAV